MAQVTTLNLGNVAGPAVQTWLNERTESLDTKNSGPTTPNQTRQYQDWVDTSGSTPKWLVRNTANTAWVEIGNPDAKYLGFFPDPSTANVGDILTITDDGERIWAPAETASGESIIGAITYIEVASLLSRASGDSTIGERILEWYKSHDDFDFSTIPTPSGADLILSSTGSDADSYEWKTIVQTLPYSSILGILNHVETNQANPNGRRLIDYFRSTYDLVLPLPPRSTPTQVFLGLGEDTFWQEYFPLPKPSAGRLVLTSSGPNTVRWDEAPSQGTQTANEMIVNPTADSRIFNAATLASAISTRTELDGDYLLILGNLNDLDLTANRLIDAAKIRIAIVDSSNVRTNVHEENWTRIQDRRLIPFNISAAEESGAANRFQREDGRTLYKFTVTFLDSSDNPITELNHHAPLWIEDGVLPISAGLESGEFSYRLIGSNLTNNSIFTVLDTENTLYIEATITNGLGIATKVIKTLEDGSFQNYVIEEQNQNVAGFRLSRTGNNITVSNLSRIDSLKVENVSCRGVKGDRGEAGPVSTIPGPQGPAGPASTIPGPQGPAGRDGNTGDPQGLRIASTTFTVDQDAAIVAENWVLTPDSSGNLISGTRLSLRTHRPTSGVRDHTARIGYMFRIKRSSGGGEVIDSAAMYLYGQPEKLKLGLNAQIVSTLAHGSVDLTLSYGRTGSFVDVVIANAEVSNEWSVTTFEQSYSLDVYELNVQGLPGEKGEKGDTGPQPPLGDRARSIGASPDNGDSNQAARADHKHDLKISSDFAFSSDDVLGLSDSFSDTISKLNAAPAPFFEPSWWVITDKAASIVIHVASSLLEDPVAKLKVTIMGVEKTIAKVAGADVYPIAFSDREAATISVRTGTNKTITVQVDYLESDDTVDSTQSAILRVVNEAPIGIGVIKDAIEIEKADYDALSTPITNTLYLIKA